MIFRQGMTVAAMVAAFGSASLAADLNKDGGMADLEERVAELEATVAKKGNRKVSLTMSGEVSKALLWFDKGDTGGGYSGVSENYNYGSRIRVVGEAKTGKDWSAGYLIEFGLGDATQLGEQTAIAMRHNAVWIGTPAGRVYLGHTSTASDGIVELNLSNSNVAALTPLGVGNAFDGGRTGVAKWVSPNISGFEVQASRANDTTNDVAIRYAGEFAGIRVAVGGAYTDGTITGNSIGSAFPGTRLAGSASVMHVATGIFLTGSAAQSKFDGATETLKAYSATAGIERNVFGFGGTTLFAEWTRADFLAGLLDMDSRTTILGGGVVQRVDNLGLDLFATVRQFDNVDAPSKVNVFMIGTRIQF